MSTNSIMGDSIGLPYNWVFLAVTWDGSLSTSNMTYYFGSQTNAATPDATVTVYNRLGVVQTNIPNTGQGTVGGYSPIAGGSRTSTTGPTRGYIDEFHLFNRALTLAEIRQVQIGGTVPPVLGIASAAHNTTVEWGPTTTPQMQFQLQSRTNLISGAWANVTNTPLDSGNTRSVTLPATNGAKFFRLKSQ